MIPGALSSQEVSTGEVSNIVNNTDPRANEDPSDDDVPLFGILKLARKKNVCSPRLDRSDEADPKNLSKSNDKSGNTDGSPAKKRVRFFNDPDGKV